MKKSAILFVICLWAISSQSQTIKVGAGKKIKTVSVIKMNTTVNQMGTDMEIPATTNLDLDFDVKSVSDKQVVLSSTLKKIYGSVTVMGNEQKFDSNDSSTTKNPMMAEALKNLNKPGDLTVEVGKPKLTQDFTGAQSGEEILNSLFIPIDGGSAKEGLSWGDSSAAEGSKMFNNYTITKVANNEVVVKVISSNTIVTTKQQMGMEVKVNMKAVTTGLRTFDVNSGLLKSASYTFTSDGNNEVMGNSFPVTIKGTANITVN